MDDGDRANAIALATVAILGITDEQAAAGARVWAECLVEAADAAGVPVPDLWPYTVDHIDYYGFRIGPSASRIDCGFAVEGSHEMIRVLDRQGDLHLWNWVAAVFQWFGLHLGEDWYFGLEGEETLGINLAWKYPCPDYYGKEGREAIVYAIRLALTFYKK